MSFKVLVVDDTRTIRFQLREMLHRMKFEVMEASDGTDALIKIRGEKPHIVLMDIMMPNMDGIECCRRIKDDPKTKDIKVVMVTAKGDYAKVNEAFRARCDDFITKPVAENELASKLEDLSRFVHASMTLKGSLKSL